MHYFYSHLGFTTICEWINGRIFIHGKLQLLIVLQCLSLTLVCLLSNLVGSSGLTTPVCSEPMTDCLSIVWATLREEHSHFLFKPHYSVYKWLTASVCMRSCGCALVHGHETTAPDICRLFMEVALYLPDSRQLTYGCRLYSDRQDDFLEHQSAHAGLIAATDPWISTKQEHRAAVSQHIKEAIAICRI